MSRINQMHVEQLAEQVAVAYGVNIAVDWSDGRPQIVETTLAGDFVRNIGPQGSKGATHDWLQAFEDGLMYAERHAAPEVSEVQIRVARDATDMSIFGWASVLVAGCILLNNIQIRTSPEDGIILKFPRVGGHPLHKPVTTEMYDAIQAAVVKGIGEML